MTSFSIAGRPIGPGLPPYVIAEMSGNHGGNLKRALEIVRAAARTGADALKLQTYTADTLTIDCRRPEFTVPDGSLWAGRSLYELYQEAATPFEWHRDLMEEARRLGMHCFSTPFDETAVEALEALEVPAFKIASFELVDTPLLAKVGATGKPVILSTGMASREEIQTAVDTLRNAGCKELALLKCTSAYPAPPEEMNLATIPDLVASFGVPVGLSDHTLGIAASVAAVALGACIIEKHLTRRRADGGPDAAFSLEPGEFSDLVDAVQAAAKSLGEVRYGSGTGESASRAFRRSLFAVQDIAKGEPFTSENVRSIRPGHGLPPAMLQTVLSSRAACAIARGTPLTKQHLA